MVGKLRLATGVFAMFWLCSLPAVVFIVIAERVSPTTWVFLRDSGVGGLMFAVLWYAASVFWFRVHGGAYRPGDHLLRDSTWVIVVAFSFGLVIPIFFLYRSVWFVTRRLAGYR